jgi:hypothetical protein
VFGRFTKPNQRLSRIVVDIPHNPDLMTPFFVTALIDTNSINPQSAL